MLGTHSAEVASHPDRVTTVFVLTTIAGGCACAVCPLGYLWEGRHGVQQGLTACMTCWLTGILAIELCRAFQDSQAVYGLALTGILVRMVLPLALCGASSFWLGMGPSQCLAICFVLIYPVFLAAETYFIVHMLNHANP